MDYIFFMFVNKTIVYWCHIFVKKMGLLDLNLSAYLAKLIYNKINKTSIKHCEIEGCVEFGMHQNLFYFVSIFEV